MMNSITLENFRCFREEQTARLAPLTLLVGENSTGKTSFLAMIRAVLDISVGFKIPDFKENPYDLGSFDDIAHHRGGSSRHVGTFDLGFDAVSPVEEGEISDDKPFHFEVTFGKKGTTPFPTRRHFARGDTWFEEHFRAGRPYNLRVGTHRGVWERQIPDSISVWYDRHSDYTPPILFLLSVSVSESDQGKDSDFRPLPGTPDFKPEDMVLIRSLAFEVTNLERLLFASAPVRSKPRRTYDPSRPTPDPEGDYIPMFLADLFFQDKQSWGALDKRLQDFGKASGLFDEISIKPLGKRGSEPFQVQIRKFGGNLKGPQHNLIDVGYGVSQALPVITELLRSDAPRVFLLQQPEVHLHPRAQAAMGSLFCQVASPERQLVVETHSDHLLDRVRMDIRDGEGALKPEDVSILFFERRNLDVRIHSLRIDEEGNIMHAPEGYRRFFMEEISRSLWKRQLVGAP